MYCLLCILKIVKACEKQELRRRKPLPDVTAQLKSVHVRHTYVSHHNIRLHVLHHFKRLEAISRMSYHMKTNLLPGYLSLDYLYYILFVINQ